MNGIDQVNEGGEIVQCRCGNAPHLEGFEPCNVLGVACQPRGAWSGHYRCDRCGHVIKAGRSSRLRSS
jgi:hypothetical protein